MIMIVFPNCKINLGLQILRKRNDAFHDLETVFYPIALHDGLEIIQNPDPHSREIEFSMSGSEIESPAADNLCVKAYQLLKKKIPQLAPVKMHLHKVIPSGAGLGGGSSDGAFTLLLLNKKFNLGLPEHEVMDYALQLGSDCPFFIRNKPCYAYGRGEKMEELDLTLSEYKIILVNPGITVHTAQAFSRIKPNAERPSLKELIQLPTGQWKEILKNDFEEVIFSEYPPIKAIKEKLYEQGAIYASMSGSGSSVYGIFEKNAETKFSFPSYYFIKEI